MKCGAWVIRRGNEIVKIIPRWQYLTLGIKKPKSAKLCNGTIQVTLCPGDPCKVFCGAGADDCGNYEDGDCKYASMIQNTFFIEKVFCKKCGNTHFPEIRLDGVPSKKKNIKLIAKAVEKAIAKMSKQTAIQEAQKAILDERNEDEE
jgi:hypothetical protein